MIAWSARRIASTPAARVAGRAATSDEARGLIPDAGPRAAPSAAGAVGTRSAIVPSASTACNATIRPRTAPCRGNRLPDALRPIMPPMVVTARLAGSGPKVLPTRDRCRSSWAATTPACTRAVPLSASISTTRRIDRARSITTPSPSAPPHRPDPAPRACTGMPSPAAQTTVAATSSTPRGRTIASGSTSNRLPSVAYSARLASSHRTSPATTPRRSSAILVRS
jgi:hypothetical protein